MFGGLFGGLFANRFNNLFNNRFQNGCHTAIGPRQPDVDAPFTRQATAAGRQRETALDETA